MSISLPRFLLRAVLATACLPAMAEPSNKWRIEVSSDADSSGVVVFQLAPVGLAPMEARVDIPIDTDENDVARLIRDALQAQLGGEYRVELDDAEDVLVKKREGAPDFDLLIRQLTVEGLRIELDRE